jgi:dephospho-CoA kinase
VNPHPAMFRPDPPVVIGLTGGVASGKSTVAAAFAAHGLQVVDADRVARRVVARPETAARIRERFGDGVFDAAGSLLRERLAERVFSDAEARADLEAITHPEIRKEILAAIAAAEANGESVVVDAPLLVEGGLIDRCDTSVFVEADEAARRARAKARGWSDDELARREQNQAPLSVKKSRCAYTIRNNRSLEDIPRQVEQLLALVRKDLQL